jgi:signal transduction histidine kinase
VSFRLRKAPGAITFGMFLVTIVLYSFGYAFEIHSNTLSEILFWLKVEYIGIPYFPTLLLIFSLQFAGKDYWLKPWFIGILLSISTATLLVQLTNAGTHWFYAQTLLDTTGPFPLIHTVKGFWYWIHQGYSILSMSSFNLLFIIMFLQKDKKKRRQALMMLISSVAPWTCYIIYITGHSPHGIDLIPFSFVIMGFITAWAMFKYKLFDLAPLALENVFESMSDGVIILDQQDRVSSYNKAAQEVFESLTQKYIGIPIQALNEIYPELSYLNNGNVALNKDLEIRNGKAHKHYEVKVSIVYNKTDQKVGKTLIFRDITERKHAEQLLLSNQNRLWKLNQTKDKLFSIIGHDLRGPLGNIQNLTVMMNDSYDKHTDADRRRIARILQSSSAQSLKLLENLLLWAKSQTGGIQFNPQKFRLNSVIKETLEVLWLSANEKQISIENMVSEEINVNADPQMISLIIRNLVSNAIKFTNKDGQISLSAVYSKKETIVRVEDNGIGIPVDMIGNLFSLDRNIRRNGTDKEIGTGLGLLLSKEFVDQHHGKIGVESSSEKGTVFFFTIPS